MKLENKNKMIKVKKPEPGYWIIPRQFTYENGEEENSHHPAAVHEHHLDDVGWFRIFPWKTSALHPGVMVMIFFSLPMEVAVLVAK